MKMPKLPSEWEELDSLARARIDEVVDLSAQFLTQAGYNADSLDENGDPITDQVQYHLMEALLRAPHLYRHVSTLVDLTQNQVAVDPEPGSNDLDANQRQYMEWTLGADDAALRMIHWLLESELSYNYEPVAHWKLRCVRAEMDSRKEDEEELAGNEKLVPVTEDDLESDARQDFVDWAAQASLEDLSDQLAASYKVLGRSNEGSAADEIEIVTAELQRRTEDFKAKA